MILLLRPAVDSGSVGELSQDYQCNTFPDLRGLSKLNRKVFSHCITIFQWFIRLWQTHQPERKTLAGLMLLLLLLCCT